MRLAMADAWLRTRQNGSRACSLVIGPKAPRLTGLSTGGQGECDSGHAATQYKLGFGRIVRGRAPGPDGIRQLHAQVRTQRAYVRKFARAAGLVRTKPISLLRSGVAAPGMGFAG